MQKRIEFARERHFICSCRNKRAINSVSLPVYNTSLKGSLLKLETTMLEQFLIKRGFVLLSLLLDS